MFAIGEFKLTRAVLVLMIGVTLGLCLATRASADDNVRQTQQMLRDKGYDPGPIDGSMGAKTREALRQYQRSQNLPVSGHLDEQTSGKLGVGQESEKGDFKSAGKDVGRGGEGLGHEMKEGKPVAAGKDLGEGIGKGAKKTGEGVKKAVSPKSDNSDPEKR